MVFPRTNAENNLNSKCPIRQSPH